MQKITFFFLHFEGFYCAVFDKQYTHSPSQNPENMSPARNVALFHHFEVKNTEIAK